MGHCGTSSVLLRGHIYKQRVIQHNSSILSQLATKCSYKPILIIILQPPMVLYSVVLQQRQFLVFLKVLTQQFQYISPGFDYYLFNGLFRDIPSLRNYQIIKTGNGTFIRFHNIHMSDTDYVHSSADTNTTFSKLRQIPLSSILSLSTPPFLP